MFINFLKSADLRQSRVKSITGFTLVELMITLVILGVIAAVAIPTYSHIVKRLRRADAIEAMVIARANLERCKQNDGRSYNGCLPMAGGFVNTNARYYNISLQLLPNAAAATNYILIAVPRPGTSQVDDTDCARLEVNRVGERTAADDGNVANPDCW